MTLNVGDKVKIASRFFTHCPSGRYDHLKDSVLTVGWTDGKTATLDETGRWLWALEWLVLPLGTEETADEVNSPSHYLQGGIECIDAIKAALTPEEYRGYLKGNVLKYVWRERTKQQDISLEKAQWYINKLLEPNYEP